MSDTLTITGIAKTTSPERYAKQLASHLGRRCRVDETHEGTLLTFELGACLLVSTDGALELRASAGTDDNLLRIQDVVASHLERFGQRNELQVEWVAP